MKVKIVFMCFAFLIVLSACSGGGNVEKKLTLESVTQAMENEGLKIVNIHPKGTKP
jgi:predicted component of type VI protein secretion system